MPFRADLALSPAVTRLAYLLMAAGFAAVACVLVLASWQDTFAGFSWDDSYYLLMADRMSPFVGHKVAALPAIVHQRSYPPMYPLLLAMAGAGSGAIGAAHLATTLALVAGLGFFYLWLRRESIDAVSAWCLTLACALSPVTILHFQTLWSEHLYLALSMACLLCVTGRERDDPQWWLAAVLVAACAATRTAGWSLVAAFVVVVLASGARPRAYLLALAIVPALAERLVNALSATGTPTYQGEMLAHLGEHLSVESLATMARSIWQALVTGLGGSAVFAAIAIVLAGLVWASRLRTWRIDAIYLATYLAVIAGWGFPEHAFRFIYPVMPLLIFYAFAGGREVWRRAWRLPAAMPAGALGLLVFIFAGVPGAVKLAGAQAEPAPAGLEDYRNTYLWTAMDPPAMRVPAARLRQAMISDMARLREVSGEDECVYTEFPPLVQMYGKRLAIDPPWNDLGEMGQAGGGCRWYYLLPMYRDEWPRYARQLPAGRYTVVHRTTMPDPEAGLDTLSILIRF